MVIDGTGKNYKKIEGQVKELRDLGYDCYMKLMEIYNRL